MTTVLLDTHVLVWWAASPERVSTEGTRAIHGADDVAVADITWFELARLVRQEKIVITTPLASWLNALSANVRTISISPAIAATAVGLPSTFPGDPADRLIYATAIENGCRLVTKDERLRAHRHAKQITVW